MGEVGKGMVGFCDDIILAFWKAVKFAGKLYALALESVKSKRSKQDTDCMTVFSIW